MEITKETKLSDLVGQYPWLKEELSKVNDKFKMLNTPMDKTMKGWRSRISEIQPKMRIQADYKNSSFTR